MRTRRAAIALGLLTAVIAGCGSDEPVRTIELSGRPSAVVVSDGLVWVSDDSAHVVHTLDGATGSRVGIPISVARNPIALAAAKGTVWVAHAGGEVTTIDVRSRRAARPIEIGRSITGVAARGTKAWAVDLPNGTLLSLDARERRVVRVSRVPDGVVRVAHAGEGLWVTNQERTVTRVEIARGEVGRAVDVGQGPIGLAFDGQVVWVANSDDGTVSRLDGKTGRRRGPPVRVGRGPVAVAYGNRSIWVANQDEGTLSRIDTSNHRVVGEPIRLGLQPRGVAYGAGAVWVAGTNPSGVVRVDLG